MNKQGLLKHKIWHTTVEVSYACDPQIWFNIYDEVYTEVKLKIQDLSVLLNPVGMSLMEIVG